MATGLLQDLAHLDVPLVEKIVRTLVVYGFLVVGLRLAGKRELAQLNPFDLVVLLTLSNTVQNAIIGPDNSLLGGLISAATLLTVNYLVVRTFVKNAKLERLIEGEPDVLIDGGRICTEKLTEDLITLAELEAAARKQGFRALCEVEQATLEPSGAVSFIRKEPTTEQQKFAELIRRLDALAADVAALRARSEAPGPSAS